MQTCLICLDDDNNLINPKHCLCKVYLHQKCLFMIGSYGLLCPICRIKTSNKPTYILPHIFNNHMSFIHYIKSIETLKSEFINNANKDFKEHNMNSKISRVLNKFNIQ